MTFRVWHTLCFMGLMHDAVIVTLCILIAVLLRRSLLTDSDAAPGVRAGRRTTGSTTLAPVVVTAESPHPARRAKAKREGL